MSASQAWLPVTSDVIGDTGLDPSKKDPSAVEEALARALASAIERSWARGTWSSSSASSSNPSGTGEGGLEAAVRLFLSRRFREQGAVAAREEGPPLMGLAPCER